MQRDHAWHSARHLEDLESAAEIGRRAGERAVARLNPTRPKPGRYPVLVRSARLVDAARPFRRRDQRLVDRAQDELPSGQARRAGVRARRHDRRRSAAAARPAVAAVRCARACGSRRQELVADGILNSWIAESASARQLGIAADRPCGARRRRSAGRSARATCTWSPAAAAARNCLRHFRRRC